MVEGVGLGVALPSAVPVCTMNGLRRRKDRRLRWQSFVNIYCLNDIQLSNEDCQSNIAICHVDRSDRSLYRRSLYLLF
jgi:hypothetical protein